MRSQKDDNEGFDLIFCDSKGIRTPIASVKGL